MKNKKTIILIAAVVLITLASALIAEAQDAPKDTGSGSAVGEPSGGTQSSPSRRPLEVSPGETPTILGGAPSGTGGTGALSGEPSTGGTGTLSGEPSTGGTGTLSGEPSTGGTGTLSGQPDTQVPATPPGWEDPIAEAAKGAADATAEYFVVDVAARLIFQYSVMYPWMLMYGESFPNNYEKAILANPSLLDPSAEGYNPLITNAIAFSIKIMMPFYVMAIVLTGAYMIFISSSPEARGDAKNLLKRLVVSMVVFSMSPLIVEAMLVTSQNISSAIISQADPTNVKMVLDGGIWGSYIIFCKLSITDLEIAIAYWTSLFVMAWLPYMVIGMRHIMMTLFCMAFPVGIALYSFVYLRGIGRKILEQTIVWIYLQAFLAVAILVISLGASYYYMLPPDQNPKLTNYPIPIVMDKGALSLIQMLGINIGASETPVSIPGMRFAPPIVFGITSILSYSIGAMAYGLLVAVPFMMLRLLNKFLP